MKQKMKLKKLELMSFVTMQDEKQNTLRGGLALVLERESSTRPSHTLC